MSYTILRNRAQRIHEALPSAPGLLALNRSWAEAISCFSARDPSILEGQSPDPRLVNKGIVHGVASLMVHVGRPELIAREILDLLDVTDTVISATAVARTADGSVET